MRHRLSSPHPTNVYHVWQNEDTGQHHILKEDAAGNDYQSVESWSTMTEAIRAWNNCVLEYVKL